MTKEKLKDTAAIAAALAWLCYFAFALWNLVGKALLWLLLAGVLALAVLFVVNQLKRRRALLAKGYEVNCEINPGGVYRFVYRERSEGVIRELRVPGELIEYGHPVYYRLSGAHWAEIVPEWALHRQLQVEARILENHFYRPNGF
jgi:hypothetical protein